MKKAADINAYIADFPEPIQKRLEQIRQLIRKEAREATETINYGIPTFVLNGNLVHFAGYKNHIGFYPGAGGIAAFQNEFSGFVTSKGTVQFPHDKPLPVALIRRIVKFRVKVNQEKANAKMKPETGFLSALSAPARRALENEGIRTLKKLSGYSEKEILDLHGIGNSSLPILRKALKTSGLSFKKK